MGEVDVSTHARTWVRADSAVRTCVKGQVLGEAVLTYARRNFTWYPHSAPASKAATARHIIGSMKSALGVLALVLAPYPAFL